MSKRKVNFTCILITILIVLSIFTLVNLNYVQDDVDELTSRVVVVEDSNTELVNKEKERKAVERDTYNQLRAREESESALEEIQESEE